ncbi:MAG TPA: ribosomal protein S18-alanine N-acetyltransferase [Methylophilaceae bacterium]|nr:ribosomal protein S18-alanine N-acetyltransferase [Methylophilaceae bacterium]
MNALLKPSFTYRPMQADDLDAVMAIEPRIYSHPWTRGNFADSLRAGYDCQVCESDGELIGYGVLMLVLDEAHLLNISIAKAFQGRGLGRALLNHFIGVARGRGAQMMFLEVRPSNTSAIRLYESMGFNEFSVRKGYYPADNGREDAVLMGLAL